MNTLKRRLLLAGCVVALGLGTGSVMAQSGGASPDFNDLTPIYQEILDAQRKSLAVTNDNEWTAISPKLLRVVQLKLEAHTVEVRSLFDGTYISSQGGVTSGSLARLSRMKVIRGALPDVPHEAEDALQKALANQAPMADINAAVAKVRAARQQKQADMTKAQSDLRAVLTPRQAAVLVARGMLD
ncbi:MAG TPA: hypothetical protein VN765_13665 [Candidatus Acidoferrum sp.]|nr:hypothetical protein [Candidatus Acidoferrum sp.]